MRKFFFSNWPVMLFIFTGIAGGFLYWRFIGCNSGTCFLTSNWHASSLAGGLIGYLGGSSILDMFRKKQN